MEKPAKYHRLAYNKEMREKEPSVHKTAQGKCEIIRFFFERTRKKVDN